MDLAELGEFIRRQRASLEAEKRILETKTEIITMKTDGNQNQAKALQEKQVEEVADDMFHWKDTISSPQLERRAVTAGELPQSVGDSFYSYFPSFNSVKQRKLEETRKEYFQYLKAVGQSSSPRQTAEAADNAPKTPTVPESAFEDLDDRRRMEKDRLAVQFQKSNRQSILNYQTVEDRNKSVEEEAARKKQEYYNALMQQIEERKRRVEAKKAREKLDDEIMDRKIELCEVMDLEKAHNGHLKREERPKASNVNEDMDNCSGSNDTKLSYNYFSNSAKESGPREIVRRVEAPPTSQVVDNKHCCEHYKQILDKLESLCRWRDDFVAKKKGCLLCDSGNLKNCNFCDYHETVVKARAPLDFYDTSSSDSDPEAMRISRVSIRKPAKKGYKSIKESMADKPTPQAIFYKSPEIEKSDDKRPETQGNSSFINFDDIPLPAPRTAAPNVQSTTTTRQYTDEEDIWTNRSRLRFNEMKRVEWKWNIPAVQTNNITKDKPEKVLTQLGAIRKQLQMEQFQTE